MSSSWDKSVRPRVDPAHPPPFDRTLALTCTCVYWCQHTAHMHLVYRFQRVADTAWNCSWNPMC